VAAGAEQAAAGLAGKTTRGMFADEILGVHLHALGSGGPPGETNIYFFSCAKTSGRRIFPALVVALDFKHGAATRSRIQQASEHPAKDWLNDAVPRSAAGGRRPEAGDRRSAVGGSLRSVRGGQPEGTAIPPRRQQTATPAITSRAAVSSLRLATPLICRRTP
jgi:hypothetical protein